jgi:hypothetical protein
MNTCVVGLGGGRELRGRLALPGARHHHAGPRPRPRPRLRGRLAARRLAARAAAGGAARPAALRLRPLLPLLPLRPRIALPLPLLRRLHHGQRLGRGRDDGGRDAAPPAAAAHPPAGPAQHALHARGVHRLVPLVPLPLAHHAALPAARRVLPLAPL